MNRYFDNAVTSFPKSAAIEREITRYFKYFGGTYGRGAYRRIIETSGIVEETRECIAKKLGTTSVERIHFSANATTGLNTILFGLDLRGCRVLVSPLEHHSVMRPLHVLQHEHDVKIDILPHGSDGRVLPEKIPQCIRNDTRLVIVNHQSNINGCIQPVSEIRKAIGTVSLLVDAAQSLGNTPVCIDQWGIDFLAFTGHKGLRGPTGTGGMYIKCHNLVRPLLYGGTGSRSEDFSMPDTIPDKYEAGTPNVAGIFGLYGALQEEVVPGYSVDDLKRIMRLVAGIRGVTVFGANDFSFQGPLFSLTHTTIDCGIITEKLEKQFGIETRCGLHCAPLAHQSIGTFPSGTVRFSFSPFHTRDDLDYLYSSLVTVLTE